MLISSYDPEKISLEDYLLFQESICENPYLPFKPYPKQSWPIFIANKQEKRRDSKGKVIHNRVLAGAGGFGGKTYLGSMLAAQYLTEPNYSCLVTRKNYTELIGIDSIFQNLVEWVCDTERLGNQACKKVESKLIKITSPYGAEIHFKAFDREAKKQKIKSESYDRIINDEASELDRAILTFQNRSLRQAKDSRIPLSVINLSNPGGPSTDYLVEKFVDGPCPYISIDWRDNTHIDKDDYEASLDELDPIDREYQKYGNWHYKPKKGDLFDRDTLDNAIVDEFNKDKFIYNVMSMDLAGEGVDTTAISATSQLNDGNKITLDLNETPSRDPETMVYKFLEKWNPEDEQLFTDMLLIEDERGGDSLFNKRHWKRELGDFLERGLKVSLIPPVKSKYQRARPMSQKIRKGKYFFSKECEKRFRIVKKGPRKGTKLWLLEEAFQQLIQLDPEGKGKSPNLVDSLTQSNNYLEKKFNRRRAKIIA